MKNSSIKKTLCACGVNADGKYKPTEAAETQIQILFQSTLFENYGFLFEHFM